MKKHKSSYAFIVRLSLLTTNVVPPNLSATFDIRLANDVDIVEFDKMVKKYSIFI